MSKHTPGSKFFFGIVLFLALSLLAASLAACSGYLGQRGVDVKLGSAADAAYDAVKRGEEEGTVPEDTSWTDIVEVLGIILLGGSGLYGAKKGVQYIARKEDSTPVKTAWGEPVPMEQVAAAGAMVDTLNGRVAELEAKVSAKPS